MIMELGEENGSKQMQKMIKLAVVISNWLLNN